MKLFKYLSVILLALLLSFNTINCLAPFKSIDGFSTRTSFLKHVDQFTINEGSNTSFSSNSTTTYNQTIPAFNGTIISTALALCGYSWDVQQDAIFNLTMTTIQSSLIFSYEFTVNGTMQIYYISYFLLVLTSAFDGGIDLYSLTFPPVTLKNNQHNTIHTQSNPPSTSEVLYFPYNFTSVTKINVFIIGFNSSISNIIVDQIKIFPDIQNTNALNRVLTLYASDNAIQWLQISIVFIKQGELIQNDYILYNWGISLSSKPHVFKPQGNFAAFDTTFDYCMFGIYAETIMQFSVLRTHYYKVQPGGFLSQNITYTAASVDTTSQSYNFLCLKECLPQYAYNFTTKTCVFCNATLMLCLECLNSTKCLTCLTALNSTTGLCKFCNQSMTGCSLCLSNTLCTVCYSGYYLNKENYCNCKFGWPLNASFCTNVVGCLEISTISQKDYCTSCDPSKFQPQPVNNSCICLSGSLATGFCTGIFGCITVININGIQTCLACNISLLLELSEEICYCIQYYQFQESTNTCQEICGDGHLIDDECDDGNTISGDGCSSICNVQKLYKCYNGSISTVSACVFIGKQLKLSVLSILRDLHSDKGYFKFGFSPNISLTLNKMIFTTKNVIFSINSSFEVTALAFQDGVISIQVTFTKDLEGLNSSISIFYGENLINLTYLNLKNENNTSNYEFQAISDNIPLRISMKYHQIFINWQILQYLSYVALILFAIGSFFRKMLGIQCLYVFQLLFFYQIFIKDYSLIINSFDLLKFTTNWYTYPAYKNGLISMVRIDNGSYNYFKSLNRLNLNHKFTENMFINNIIEIMLIATLSLLILLKIIYEIKNIKPTQYQKQIENKAKKEQKNQAKQIFLLNEQYTRYSNIIKNIQKTCKYFYDHAFFPLFVVFVIQITFCFYFSCLKLPALYSELHYEAQYKNKLNTCLMLISFFGLAGIVGAEGLQLFVKNKKSDEKSLYCIIFLMFMLLQSLAMILFTFFENTSATKQAIVFVLFAINLTYFIFLLFYHPYISYQSNLHNFSAISNQFIVLSFSGVIAFEDLTPYFYDSTYFFPEEIQIMILFVFIGLLIFIETFTSIRIALEIKNCYQNWMKEKQSEQQNIEQKAGEQNNGFNSKRENVKKINNINFDDEFLKLQTIYKNSLAKDYSKKEVNFEGKDKQKIGGKDLTSPNEFLKTEKIRLRQSLMSYLKRIEEEEEKQQN